MTAQYRPYKDDGYEADNSREAGIEIYENNHESFNKKKSSKRTFIFSIIGFLSLFVLTFLLYKHFHSSCDIDNYFDDYSNTKLIKNQIHSLFNSSSIKEFIKEFSSKPHMAGTDTDRDYAEKIENYFNKFGLINVHKKSYKVFLSLPDRNHSNFVSIIDQDNNEWFNTLSNKFTGYCYYSSSGDIIAEPLFVNYGRPIDYLQIQDIFNRTDNIFKDKILIAKQFHISSSEQYKYANFMQAAGLLLYPDPEQYNPNNEKPFPDSYWLPSDGVKSDSTFWNGVGDPETFEVSSLPYAYREDSKKRLENGVPAQPISYASATEIFKQLQGKNAPIEWQGKLNVSYKLGPNMINNRKLRLRVNNVHIHKMIHNVFGMIHGQTEPDRYIIVGHQRDSASYGAFSSASGTGNFLELIRVFMELFKKNNWKPKRTIIFASFGAEEFNLIGSTEWLQEMEKILSSRTIAYININKLVSGNDSLKVLASPLLYNLIFNVTSHVQMSSQSESVYDKWLKNQPILRESTNLVVNHERVNSLLQNRYSNIMNSIVKSNSHDQIYSQKSDGSILYNYLKSAFMLEKPKIINPDLQGSYSSFVTIAGIPVIDIQFIKNNHQEYSQELNRMHYFYPLEGTQYDQFDAIEKYIDPEFEKHTILGTILADIIFQLSSSIFLPINILDYTQRLFDFYLKSLYIHDNYLKEHFEEDYQTKIFTNLMNSLESAICNLTLVAIDFHAYQDKINSKNILDQRRLNDQLMFIERYFLDSRGIPGNNFRKHIVLSPADTFNSFDAFETEGLFPALVDEMSELLIYKKNINETFATLQKHLPILIQAIQTAALSLNVL